MGICRFGSLIKYIPYTITTGFTCGIAVTLFVGQLKDFFGLQMKSVPSEFWDKIIAYGKNIGTINVTATVIGLVAVAIMLIWPKVTDKIPGSLVAIIVTTAIVYFAKLDVNTIGSVYGQLNSSFPKFHVPAISMKLVQQMLSPAFTIAVLAAIESLLSAVVSDGMIGDTHKSNAELIGQGLGNIFSGLFGGIPATGAIARTAANVRNGGRTPIAGITHCVTLTIILLVLMPLAALIPMTTLAAVLLVVAANMADWESFFRLCKSAPKSDIIVLVATFFLTVFFDLVVAIEIGVVLAALLFMKRMAETADIKAWKYTDSPDITLGEAEGIESKKEIHITEGTIVVNTYDDALNATNKIDISGGRIYAYASNNDGIDSNGTLYISGGLVISTGSSQPEEGFDCDQNTFSITGGTLIGLGGSSSTPTSSVTTQPVSLLSGMSLTQGKQLTLQTSDGTLIWSFLIPRTLNQATILVSSPQLSVGSSYTLTTGGTASGGSSWQGYTTDATVSGGSTLSSFTQSSMVNGSGSSMGGGGGPGGGGGGPGGGGGRPW